MGRRRVIPENAVQQTVHLAPKTFDLLNAVCRVFATPDDPIPRTTVSRIAVEIGLEQLAKEMGIDPDNPLQTPEPEDSEL